MSWSIDTRSTKFKSMTRSAEKKWDEFVRHIELGATLQDAADMLGKSCLKLLSNGVQWQIRLSQSERATFELQDSTSTIKVFAVGGHT